MQLYPIEVTTMLSMIWHLVVNLLDVGPYSLKKQRSGTKKVPDVKVLTVFKHMYSHKTSHYDASKKLNILSAPKTFILKELKEIV